MITISEAMRRAIAFHQAGNLPAAEQIYRQILQVVPGHADATHFLGVMANQTGRHEIALQYITAALAQQPNNSVCHTNLGAVYLDLGRPADAIASLQQALRLQPHFAEAHSNLGNAYRMQGRLSEAVASCQRAVELRPELAVGFNNLGIALGEQDRLDEALASFRECLRLQPDFPEAHNNVGKTLVYQGHLDEALGSFREAVRLKPDFLRAHSNWLHCMNYDPQIGAEELFAEHCRWDAVNSQKAPLAAHGNPRDPDRRLRVGYVSPDLKGHPVARFLGPILASHDPAQVEAYCYAEVPNPDATTAQLRSFVAGWRSTIGVTDEQVANQVRRDGIDILVDLAGHTAESRIRIFTFKPAPVQVSYLGYPYSTGLKAIDYRITDAIADPPDEQSYSTEELVRLPGGFCCYQAPENTPSPSPLPADAKAHVTFGSLHHLAKLNGQVLDLWCAILRALPTAKLLLFRHALVGSARDQLCRRFAERGIGPDRLDVRHAAPAGQSHWHAYQEIDISLDPFPWSGHTTACESLWMGVPVVTLYGARHAGRMVASVLTQLKMTDWIAPTPERYITLAVEKANDLNRLRGLRAGLRESMRTGPLCDGRRFARELEDTYRAMWRRWCSS